MSRFILSSVGSGRVWTELFWAVAVCGFRKVLWDWSGWPWTQRLWSGHIRNSPPLLRFSPYTHIIFYKTYIFFQKEIHPMNMITWSKNAYLQSAPIVLAPFMTVAKRVGTLHDNGHACLVSELLRLNILYIHFLFRLFVRVAEKLEPSLIL